MVCLGWLLLVSLQCSEACLSLLIGVVGSFGPVLDDRLQGWDSLHDGLSICLRVQFTGGLGRAGRDYGDVRAPRGVFILDSGHTAFISFT